MVNYGSVGVLAVAVLCVVGVQQATALRCWTCSSQTDETCNDRFNRTEDNMGRVRLQDCDNDRIHSSYSSYSKAVCKKQKQRVSGGELITLRHCDWMTDHDGREKGDCGNPTAPTYIKVEYCETCTQDGCNGSPKNMLPPIWSSMLPIAIFTFYKRYNM